MIFDFTFQYILIHGIALNTIYTVFTQSHVEYEIYLFIYLYYVHFTESDLYMNKEVYK